MPTSSTRQDSAIWTESLTKIYRSGFWMRPHVGLSDLTLAVQPGEVFGFVGPNGAGKTTTIKILMGLHRATSGAAYLFGQPLADPRSRARVGFLPERPYFYEHLTARELLRFFAQLHDIPRPEADRRIGALLERVELGRFADVQLRSYSKGMLQRAGLCQALLHDPDLLILDEPMSGLDPLGRALVRDIIVEEARRGRTVFFSSHILHDIETLSDRVAIIVTGKLRGTGTVRELIGDRIRHVDCTLQGAGSLPGQLIREDGALQVRRVAPEAVDALLDQARAQGGRVLEVVPIRETLEDVLLDEVERARPARRDALEVLA
jgi:ABC-2 type transport system ATP-binding protein